MSSSQVLHKVYELGLTYIFALIGVAFLSPLELIFIPFSWWWFPLVAALITILSFLSSWIIKGNGLKKVIVVDITSFLISGAILLPFGTNFDHVILYLLTFIIIPLPLVALHVLLQIRSQISNGIIRKTTRDREPDGSANLFELFNESGKQVLSLPGNKIICFEANDNYVITYFLDENNVLKKSMDRSSLKQIENRVQKSNLSFLRVHKSFLINPIYVEGVLGRSQAYKLKLHFIQEPVSVSRSFDISLIKPQPVISQT